MFTARSALVDHGRASRSASGGTQLTIAAGLVHVDITQGTPHRRDGQLAGGGCLPVEPRGVQRGGKEMAVLKTNVRYRLGGGMFS